MPWKSVAVAVVLVLGAAPMTTRMAFARGMAGGAHFGGAHFGGGFAGHRPAIGHDFAGYRIAIRRLRGSSVRHQARLRPRVR